MRGRGAGVWDGAGTGDSVMEWAGGAASGGEGDGADGDGAEGGSAGVGVALVGVSAVCSAGWDAGFSGA